MIKSPEVRLYKMIIIPDEEYESEKYVELFGWKNDSFYVSVRYEDVENFIDYLYEQFPNNAIETKDIKATITYNHLLINLSEALDDLVDIASVFSKEEYEW